MPHVIVKMLAGRSEAEKRRLVERISLTIMNTLGTSEHAISVAVVDVDAGEWTDTVYDPDIAGRMDTIYKMPGYRRF